MTNFTQFVKTMKWSPFAYFMATVVISYLMWTIIPDEARSSTVNFCEENWSYWTNSLVWNEMWNTWTAILTKWVTRAQNEYYKSMENKWNDQPFQVLP